VVWPPWPTSARAPSRISSTRKPKTRRIVERLRRLCRVENTQREKALRQAEICREIPSRRGEIIDIVIVIELGFIRIIIIITIITRTFITIITMPSRCNILG
jgi:hypothetical protein